MWENPIRSADQFIWDQQPASCLSCCDVIGRSDICQTSDICFDM